MHVGKTDFYHYEEQTKRREDERMEVIRFVSLSSLPMVVLFFTSLVVEAK